MHFVRLGPGEIRHVADFFMGVGDNLLVICFLCIGSVCFFDGPLKYYVEAFEAE